MLNDPKGQEIDPSMVLLASDGVLPRGNSWEVYGAFLKQTLYGLSTMYLLLPGQEITSFVLFVLIKLPALFYCLTQLKSSGLIGTNQSF